MRKGAEALAHGAKVAAINMQVAMALNAKKKELKRVLLSRFTHQQLDEIALRHGIGFRKGLTKARKIELLLQKLKFDEAIEYARIYKVKHKDIVEEYESYKALLESKKAALRAEKHLEDLIMALQSFRPEPVRDEEELEKQLYQYLRARFPELPIKRQAQIGPYRVDLLVGNCSVEIKVPKSRTHLQRLLGQVGDYREYTGCVIAFILDTGKLNLDDYVERLAERGITPIVVKGSLKKTSKTEKGKGIVKKAVRKTRHYRPRKPKSSRRGKRVRKRR